MVTISRQSMITGKRHSMDINMPESVFFERYYRLKKELIQNVYPELTPEEREFIISGITPEEWDLYIKEPEE